jgi:hypothetical protein
VTIELITSEPHADEQKRIIRMLIDTRALQHLLTRAQVRAVYGELEQIRDALSHMLDRADGKLGR